MTSEIDDWGNFAEFKVLEPDWIEIQQILDLFPYDGFMIATNSIDKSHYVISKHGYFMGYLFERLIEKKYIFGVHCDRLIITGKKGY
jgi:hypothetical protein